jgi:hypothetical protein
MMKIEEGKSYRTRDGRKARNPRWDSDNHCWFLVIEADSEYGRSVRVYHSDGTHGDARVPNDPRLDLVAEWTDEPSGPVVVETVKRIVSGTHSGLQVHHVRGDDGVYITADAGLWDASKLRAGAAVMLQYADAFDEGAR